MERWRVAADRARQQSEEEITAIQRKLSDPLSEWEPELCVRLLRSPGVTNFSAIRQRLQRCTRAWMREFLELEGLDVLFTALKRLRDNGLRAVALQLECVACIRVIMNSRTGLTSIIEHQEYCVKLVKALDTKNLAVKKQLFELLSALSTYSIRGHAAVLEALDKYKIFKGFRYRFKVLMMEMQQAEHTPYKAVLLGFVNCLILCTEELHRRIRMRDEFITLGLLEIVDSFRNEDDDELAIQIEAFDENKHKDEEQAELLGILLRGDHYEFFQNIFNKNRVTQTSQRRHNIEESASSQIPAQTPSISAEVQDSPIALPFLLLLQNLSQLDPNSPESEQVWELLEKVSSKAVNGGLEHLNRGLNFHILMLNKKDEATQTPKMRRTPKPDFLCDAKVNAETQTELTPLPFQDRRNAIKRHGHSRQHVLSSDSGEEVFYDSQQVIVTPEHNESKSMENVVLSSAGLHNEQEEFQPRPFPHSSLPAPPADDAPLPPVPFNSSISSLKEEISADDSDNTLNKAEQLTVPAPVDDNFPPSPYMSRALPLSPPPPLPSVPPSTTCLTSNINENVQSIPPPPSHSPPPPPCPMDSSSNNIPLPPPLPPSSDSSQLIHATKYINNLSTDKRIDPYTTPPPPPPPPLFSPLTALNRSSEHLNLSPSLHQCIKTPSSGYQSLPSPFFSSILSENDSTSSPCNTIPSSTTTSSPLVPIGNSHLSTPVSPSMLSETIPCNNSYPIPFPQIMKDDSLSIPPPPPLPTLFPVSSENNIPPPPPPMPPSSGSCIPPPPPPMPLQSTNFGHALSPSLPAGSSFPPPPPPLPMETGSIGPPPPPFPNSVLSENASPLPHSNVHSSLYGEGNFTRPNYLQLKSLPPSIAAALARSNPYATLPRPRHKMKTLNWTKVPSQLIEDESVWKAVHTEISPNIQLDYDKVEELFCQKQSAGKAATTTTTTTTKQKKELSEITLLDSKRSLNINIFLKQFKCSLDELSSLIRTGKGNEIGAERLRGILKILPEREELELVKSFNGDVEKLGTAEKFILHMGQLPAFGLRIEALLQREEFYPSIETIRPQLDAIKTTQEDLLTNKALKEFLALVLHTGNFLNAGSYAGNAAGFKLNTLPKLYETRANKARVTLLHFLVEAAERENAEMLNFTTDMKYLAQVSRISFEGLVSEIKSIANGINKLENQLKIAPSDVETQFQNFVEKAKKEIRLLENDLDEIDQTSKKLARHFCEDEKKFKLEDCFTTFSGFCEKVKQAKIENDQRKKQEERLARIQEQRKKKPPNKLTHTDSSLFSQDEVSLIDKLLSEIKEGSFKLRKTTMSASQA